MSLLLRTMRVQRWSAPQSLLLLQWPVQNMREPGVGKNLRLRQSLLRHSEPDVHAVPTDFVVRRQDRQWFANCAWDGLGILALLGDGILETHSPASGEPLEFSVHDGRVDGEGIVHFLMPVRSFWDDIRFT